VVFVIDTVNG
jgi:hypothetical protein